MLMRPSWDEYFLKIAHLVAERSTCLRHHIGAVLVRDKHILTTGYNGAPTKQADCLTLGCLRDEDNIPSGLRLETCRAVHAEDNAIVQAALHGVSTEGATVYCTHSPCYLCARRLVNAKIVRYVTCREYPAKVSLELFKQANIIFDVIDEPEYIIHVKP